MTGKPALSCAACNQALTQSVVDLGQQPLANSYLKSTDDILREERYPLHAYVCTSCWLVQVPPVETPENIFSNYAYLSSFSDTWKTHCNAYARSMVERFHLGKDSLVVEIASNDGTLLIPFQKAGVPVLGIEPAQNITALANAAGIPTRALFFGVETAQNLVSEGIQADLIAANNVLAHVPDIHDFIGGFKVLLKPEGTITFEFPHLVKMLQHMQFDTIYHEHFSYLSLTALEPLFTRHGLAMVDVETLPTHGGSLRVFLQHAGHQATPGVAAMLKLETDFGLKTLAPYQAFGASVCQLKTELLAQLEKLRAAGKKIVAYGAPAKGNTLLNYCGITPNIISYTVDRNPQKQGCLLPGSHLPIYDPAFLLLDKPDVVFILPWNIAPEVMQQMVEIREWDGQFLIAVPNVHLA